MDELLIRKYAALMHELELTAIEINENGCAVRLERENNILSALTAPRQTLSSVTTANDNAVSAPAPAAGANPRPTGVSGALADITSPMIGVFYSSSAEDTEPFVYPGKSVKCGDVLCIIEAMKLMNEITAEQDGVIAEVCVENGSTVDFGRVLFRMKKE